MRKLKLESLHVESFATAAESTATNGTVRGHEGPPTLDFRCRTNDPVATCDTQYLDCTFACSDFASCLGGC